MIRSELEAKFESMQADKDAGLLKLGQQLKRLRDDNDALNAKIDEYREMEDALEGRSPTVVLDDLDQLPRTLHDQARTLCELESARSRDDSDAMGVERDRLRLKNCVNCAQSWRI